MKNEIWLKEREREKKNYVKIFFWAHNEKQRGDSKNKVSKTFKKKPFFEKASHKGNWQTNIFRRENKEERFPFFWKWVVDSEKTQKQKKREQKKEERNVIKKKTEKTHKKKQKEKVQK